MLFNAKYVLSALAQQQQGGMNWLLWFFMIVVVIVLFVLLWRWMGLSKGGEQSAAPIAAPVTDAKSQAASALVVATAPEPVAHIKADDLTLIEGIGPKIATVLQGVGIKTFAQLAHTELAMLEATLKAANLRLADPASWPEQAKLAADGKFDELKTLQDNLKGGRRV